MRKEGTKVTYGEERERDREKQWTEKERNMRKRIW